MKPYSIDFRQKILEVYEQEKTSIRKLAQRFRVAKSFVQNLIKQYKETGDITPKRQGGSPPTKLNSEELVSLVEIMETNNDATLEELCELLYEKTEVKVSRATMGRVTKKLNYTFKKKSLHATEKEREDVLEKRVRYWESIREINPENLLFVDESGVNLALLRLYGRSLKGERVRGSKPQKRGKNVSLIGALSLEKVVAVREIHGSVDAITSSCFYSKRFSPAALEKCLCSHG